MAIGTSGYEQGEVAGKIAARIIEQGTPPSAIPISLTTQFVVFMRPKMMQLRGIKLPMLYEAFARAKWEEWDEFRMRVSDYEIERYLEVA